MCRYKKWTHIEDHRFYKEGNNGGDYIEICNLDKNGDPLEGDLIHIEVGNCCVKFWDVVMPLPVLTILLLEITSYGDIGKTREDVKTYWPTDYGKNMSNQIISWNEYQEKEK